MKDTEKWLPLAGIIFLAVVFVLSIFYPERVTAAAQVVLGLMTAGFGWYMKVRTDYKIKTNGNGVTK